MDQDEITKQILQSFMEAGDRMMREAMGLPPDPPAVPEPSPETVLTVTRLYWDMLALGRAYVEVVRDGKEVRLIYVPQDDTVYSFPKPDSAPPSVDVWESNLSVHAEWGNDLPLNDGMINASVAYRQAGDPSWPNPPDPDEASSTSSTKTAPLRANRALRRHPGGPLDVPSPWRKPRWTRS